ncbi:cation-translocating P-type ATPase [Rhabdaerophilum sp. SD176]|uniref:heavy metal translocating P-type ATPase n=1 Tax=Rhabdaerophilum sp. SD176 TaxID=2983548 RepID=UPI0024DF46D2|nr:cation-translocating P-type ATPase [Rhabdaerophilum sp. SD176]
MTNQAFSLDIGGMTCAACAQRIERMLERDGGFASIAVDLAADRVVLAPKETLAIEEASRRAVSAIEAAGYRAFSRGGSLEERRRARALREAEARAEARWLFLRAAVSLAAFLPFGIAMVVETLQADGHHWIPPFWQLGLATLVQTFGAWPFYRQAWHAVRGRTATMDVLVVLGTGAAFLLSLWHLFDGSAGHGAPLYFEGSVAVIAFVLAGKLVEQRAKREAGAALGALEALIPEQVEIRDGELSRVIPRREVRQGMVILVRPGGMSPVDGEIVEGVAFLDESSLTGESLPIRRGPGERVQAGAVVSGGALALRVEAVEDETRIARLARLIEDAGSGASGRVPLIDLVTRIFVPAVLVIAASAFVFWLQQGVGFERAAIIAASVLVVACPCALGLATPIALMAGRRAGARLGLIVVDQGAFDPGARIDTIAFDKTGTLTRGQPELLAIHAKGDSDSALVLAAALAERSDHPLDLALRKAADARPLAVPAVEGWRAEAGGGLSGYINGMEIRLGSLAFVQQGGTGRFDALLAAMPEADRAQPNSFLGVDGEARAIFVAGDSIRPESGEAIATLRAEGLETVMLSGDRQAVVDRVAGQLGIDLALGGMKPEDKLGWLQARIGEGRVIGFVGDGLNDGPALQAVAVGFAMGTGTEVAKGAASVILARPDPRLVGRFVALARRVRRGIGENLFLAFVFNAVAIPLAVLGHLSPAIAGAAMALSSISVALNALRLARWRPVGTR